MFGLNETVIGVFANIGVAEQQFCPFLPRDALVHSAVLRLHVVRLSVCSSVRLWRWWIRIT